MYASLLILLGERNLLSIHCTLPVYLNVCNRIAFLTGLVSVYKSVVGQITIEAYSSKQAKSSKVVRTCVLLFDSGASPIFATLKNELQQAT